MAKNIKKPLATALGAAFLASAVAPAMADVNPFTANPLQSGYDLVSKADAEGKCGEGKCGAEKKVVKEGKCGGEKKAAKEGKCGGEEKAAKEGKCGGEKKAAKEGKCGGEK